LKNRGLSLDQPVTITRDSLSIRYSSIGFLLRGGVAQLAWLAPPTEALDEPLADAA
jgi:hypothetical protein